jgi:hypothetical protein
LNQNSYLIFHKLEVFYLKKICVSLSFFLTVMFVFVLSSAFATTYTICDNATSTAACSEWFSTPNHWTTSSAGYNGNLSVKNSGTYANEYIQRVIDRTGGFTNGTTSLYVYLNDAAFTNPSARYDWGLANGYSYQAVGYINQYSAPGGWSAVGSWNPGQFIQTYGIEVTTSGTSSVYTGSDAFEIVSP